MDLTFEWDEEKARANVRKHNVSFEEAKTLYNDRFLWTFPDAQHSQEEERYINIGFSSNRRLLVVIHAERGKNIRIISCRRATTNERRSYEEGNR